MMWISINAIPEDYKDGRLLLGFCPNALQSFLDEGERDSEVKVIRWGSDDCDSHSHSHKTDRWQIAIPYTCNDDYGQFYTDITPTHYQLFPKGPNDN